MELLIAFVSIILAFVFYLINPDPFRRPLRRFFSKILARHPAVAVEPDIASFAGRVEIVTDKLLSNLADSSRIKQFYEGAPLDWDIIAAHADIERDQQLCVIEQLTQQVQSLRFVCLLGESGSGKSTLAWRVAAELHSKHRALVLRVKDKEDPELWYQMTQFCSTINRPLYVLADDLFRSPEVCRALREISPWLPLTIIATSQTNEYHPGRLKGEVVPITVLAPSPQEKKHVLRCLKHDGGSLSSAQRERVESANEFLVLMVELTSGKGLHAILRDDLENLSRMSKSVYLAYEYLCFAYSYGLAIPTSILERLGPSGGNYDLPSQEGARGLFFYDESHPHCLRPGHARRAQLAMELFERQRPSISVLKEIVMATESSDLLERRFIAFLLRSLALKKADVVMSVLPQIQTEINVFIKKANRISELTIWRAFYLGLKCSEEAEHCVDIALSLEPISSIDCNLAVSLYRERGRESEALPVVDRWLHSHLDWGGTGRAYLRLVERYGTVGDQERTIAETKSWLVENSNDNTLRTAYMGLLERKGTVEQTECVLRETGSWLATHPDDITVRTTYLGLVERKGTVEQIECVLRETGSWLATHPDDITVRTTYLGLAERKGTVEQTERVLRETGSWLTAHSDDSTVRTMYLGLVERKGTVEQTERILQDTGSWLAIHPDDTSVRTTYLGLLERRGKVDQIESAVKYFPAWLREHPEATDVWTRFISFLSAQKQFDSARTLIEEALSTHSAGSNLVHQYLKIMSDQLDEPTIRRLYDSLLNKYPRDLVLNHEWARWLHTQNYWDEAAIVYNALAEKHPKYFQPFYGHGRLLLDMKRFGEAVSKFRRVIIIHRGHAMAHDGLALALNGLASHAEKTMKLSEVDKLFAEAESEFRNAIYWAGVAADSQAIFFTHLGWFYIERKRWNDAIGAFDQALSEAPEYFGNYWGKGNALMGLENWTEAAYVLHDALEKAEKTTADPSLDEIRKLISRCEGISGTPIGDEVKPLQGIF